jgi:hypothetical protein
MRALKGYYFRCFDRYSEHITRIEVKFSDEKNSDRDSENDKRCVLEARLKGLQPLVVGQPCSIIG